MRGRVRGVRVHDRRAGVDARDRLRRALRGHRHVRVVAPARDPVQRRLDDHRSIRHDGEPTLADAVQKAMVACGARSGLHRLVGDDVWSGTVEDQGRYGGGAVRRPPGGGSTTRPPELDGWASGSGPGRSTSVSPRVEGARSRWWRSCGAGPSLTPAEFASTGPSATRRSRSRTTRAARLHAEPRVDPHPDAEEIDGIAELGFRPARTSRRFYDSDDGRRVIGEDVRRFMAGPGHHAAVAWPRPVGTRR